MELFVSTTITNAGNPIQEAYDSLSPVIDDNTGFPKVPENYFWRIKQKSSDEYFLDLQLIKKTLFREKVKGSTVVSVSNSKEALINVSKELYKVEFGNTFVESLIGNYPEKKLPDFGYNETYLTMCGHKCEYDSQTGLPEIDEDMHWNFTSSLGFLNVRLMRNKKVLEYSPVRLDRVILGPGNIYNTAAFCLSQYKKNSFRHTVKAKQSKVIGELVGDYPPKSLR